MKPGNKFGAKRVQCSKGHNHASLTEARRCVALHLMQSAGLISHLQYEPQFWFVIGGVQVKHDNGRRVGFKPDFQYFEGDKNCVEEVKSAYTLKMRSDYPLRKAMFKALFPFIEFREKV